MDGEFKSFKVGDENCIVQNLAREFKKDAELRLAKIANGADPKFRNGNPKPGETRWVTGEQWDKQQSRKKRASKA